MSAKKKHLDVYLQEVYRQFVALKDNDLKKSQEVFKGVFEQLKKKMEEKCNFFCKYASQVMYGGSVSDGIKVGKMDEFDMDIVIRLPIYYGESENGIILENDCPGFVKLKITNAFDNLDKQQEWETCNKVTRDWRDQDKYFLQNKFRDWLCSLIQKALNDLNGIVVVDDRTYVLKYKASGPAYTLQVRNKFGDPDFILDIDLVPVIKFMLPRWPMGYKLPNGHKCKEWLVVPKPNKAEQDRSNRNRCWRLSFQDLEREMIKDAKNLKMTIRLVKKLRDARCMTAIASYYIKTLFLWKIEKTNDKKYWETKVSVLFREMVQELYIAIKNKCIPYFWNERNNLIEGLKPSLQGIYADKLKNVLNAIDAKDVETTVFFLLTTQEITEFKNSEFYIQMNEKSNFSQVENAPFISKTDSNTLELPSGNDDNTDLMTLVKDLIEKISVLTERVEQQNERILLLERSIKESETSERVDLDNNITESFLTPDDECLIENMIFG